MPWLLSIFGGIRGWLIGGAVLLLVGAGIFGYIWVNRTLANIHDLEHKNAVLEVSNQQWEAVAKEQRANAEKAAAALTTLQQELLAAEKDKGKVDDGATGVVTETDAAKAQEKVDRLEENVRRCLEIASGSPRTDADKDNEICP
jgi:hypothetical protein